MSSRSELHVSGTQEVELPPGPLDSGGSSGLKQELQITNYLLMTVVAGKSGQKLTAQNKQEVLEVVRKNPEIDFIVDGGWSLEFRSEIKNEELKIKNGRRDLLVEAELTPDLLDRGDGCGLKQELQNLQIVSYSSFWNEFSVL